MYLHVSHMNREENEMKTPLELPSLTETATYIEIREPTSVFLLQPP